MNENVQRLLPPFEKFWAELIKGIPENGDPRRGFNNIKISNDFIDNQHSFPLLETDLNVFYDCISKVIGRINMGVPSLFDVKGVDFSRPVFFSFFTSDQRLF